MADAKQYKLTYFPISGRAFPIRVCMKAAGLPFEDERLPGPAWRERKAAGCPGMDVPLGQLPVMALPSGESFCQSIALARFAAKKSGLYPVDDDVAALRVDEVVDTLNDVMVSAPMGGTPEELKAKREAWTASSARFLAYFERRLGEVAASGPFFLGAKLSVADLWLYVLLSMTNEGFYDHVAKDWIVGSAAYPRLTALFEAVKAHPLVVAHGQ